MTRTSEKPVLSPEELEILKKLSRRGSGDFNLAERCKLIRLSASGQTDTAIGLTLKMSSTTVGYWRRKYLELGLEGLHNRDRWANRPRVDYEATKEAMRKLLEQPPPPGEPTWDGKSLAASLNVPPYLIWRIAKTEDWTLRNKIRRPVKKTKSQYARASRNLPKALAMKRKKAGKKC